MNRLVAAISPRRTNDMKHSLISSNGITLHVVELGEGPAVLFCHGFPDTWRGWRRQMEAVAAEGYRAISLDMRGYGRSSAPADPTQYTVFQTVGDLIGLLDALDLAQVVIVGHDFGASVAWNAALMRPDRFRAVFGISIPFAPRGEKSFLQSLAEAGRTDFYMFSRIRPEADRIWADARIMFPTNLYWSSAAAAPEERWTLFDRDLPKYRTLPAPLPDWANKEDIEDAIVDFERTGFHGPLNYYRSIQLGFDLSAPFKGKLVEQPSFFLAGAEDGLKNLSGPLTRPALRKFLPNLIDSIIVPNVAHWPQLEAASETNEALLRFLREVS
jgi:pimeloyl-ACP methyl ester carboxylesterase